MKSKVFIFIITVVTALISVSCGDDVKDEKKVKVINDGSESCDTSGIYRCNGTQPEICGIAYWEN